MREEILKEKLIARGCIKTVISVFFVDSVEH